MSRQVNVSIDPGFSFGIAFWDDQKWTRLEAPLSASSHSEPRAHRTFALGNRVTYAANQIYGLIARQLDRHDWRLFNVFIELPIVIQSAVGDAAARRGDVVKLTLLTGAYTSVLWRLCHGDVEYVPVHAWKGQLPKTAVIRRIQKRIVFKTSNHAWDAVGIGLYKKGHF